MAFAASAAGAQDSSTEDVVITPSYGAISPFYGSISPFWGAISPFHGALNPSYGAISPFWGSISPFRGSISPFWTEVGPAWGELDARWGAISLVSPDDLARLADSLQGIFAQAESVFGDAVAAQSGSSFDEAFLGPLLNQYGLDLSDPASLGSMDASQRAEFFLAFYDGLMAYSGVDRFDHWMATANWSPALSEASGQGGHVTVGLIDFAYDRKTGTLALSEYSWRLGSDRRLIAEALYQAPMSADGD